MANGAAPGSTATENVRPTTWQMMAARGLIGLVLALNLQCAFAFLIQPGAYASGFELNQGADGMVIGEALLRALGLLFVMWNVPYAVACWNPRRHLVSLLEAVAMQAIGLVGESWIWLALPQAHPVARASLLRFMLFDGAGLALLLAALALVLASRRTFLPKR